MTEPREPQPAAPPARRRAATLALAAAALAVCVLASEAVLRVALDPVDFLKPELVTHGVLPHVFRPGSGGHDAWGFRNEAVPGQVDLLAIGDSMTYGVSAPREGSWPAQLGRLRRQTVYILALGGYGPQEYLHLLESHGPKLSPREIVIGVYLGNDLLDAAREPKRVERRVRPRRDTRLLGAQRSWLSSHSMLYQVTKQALPGLREHARDQLVEARVGAGTISLDASGARTTFLPEVTLEGVDLGSETVQRGLERALDRLDAIDAGCRALGARCLVALIPTKESVFAELAAGSLPDASLRRLQAVVDAEAQVRDRVSAHLREHGRESADLLPALREALAAGRTLYDPTLDSHPIASGYAVFAEAIAAALGPSGPG